MQRNNLQFALLWAPRDMRRPEGKVAEVSRPRCRDAIEAEGRKRRTMCSDNGTLEWEKVSSLIFFLISSFSLCWRMVVSHAGSCSSGDGVFAFQGGVNR